MYARLSCTLVLALALTAAALPGERGKDDAKKLEGTWTLLRGEDQGKVVPKEKLRGELVVISKKTIIANDKDNKKVFVMSYKLDPTQKPAAIDMTILEGSQKGKTAKGIYAFEKDVLKLAYAFAGDRPTSFKTKEGDKHLSFVLKRVQP